MAAPGGVLAPPVAQRIRQGRKFACASQLPPWLRRTPAHAMAAGGESTGDAPSFWPPDGVAAERGAPGTARATAPPRRFPEGRT